MSSPGQSILWKPVPEFSIFPDECVKTTLSFSHNCLFVCYIRAGAKAQVALLPSGILCALFSRSSRCRRQMSPRPMRRESSKRREGELSMGDKEYPIIVPKCRLPRNIQGSFTCRKSTTWGRRLYLPSEGWRAGDFFALKNPTASAGFEPANLGTRGQHASSKTTEAASRNCHCPSPKFIFEAQGQGRKSPQGLLRFVPPLLSKRKIIPVPKP
jgi:hypothetical protein